jgi:hypothetical protein
MISSEKIRSMTKTMGLRTQNCMNVLRGTSGINKYAKFGLIGTAGVAGLVICSVSWSGSANSAGPKGVIHQDPAAIPVEEVSLLPEEQMDIRQETAATPLVLPVPVPNGAITRRETDLAQQKQQAQLQLEAAAADYDFAVQMWNAEVAACQAVPHARYTPNQMGRFAAMGVTAPVQQQRQPNQALLQAAQQAEQRYLQAQDHFQRMNAAH